MRQSKKEAREFNKAADKIEGRMADIGVDLKKLIREQEAFLKNTEGMEEKINTDIESLEVILSEYTDDGKEPDEDFTEYSTRYYEKLLLRQELREARAIAEESIAEGKMLMPGGISTEVPTLGPKFNPERLNV